jgi:hypothetical protein
MRKSTVMSLPLQLVFHGTTILDLKRPHSISIYPLAYVIHQRLILLNFSGLDWIMNIGQKVLYSLHSLSILKI